ncbi:sigma-70 family RNA polymerase sigma factor [Maribacter sp. MMG018]|uniref:sigma-70 family RNA polymerase sigma factor n=1 Tax=Maribacter sp. MMG018 TaxID=2822688 RepID=UPI001B38E88C|nr:sigma-70 family RNA polymerase sigma factor [Maribacter sp. MMG018]MBQ4915927.1 sigma-70 family RNA polymerase sigma factor [Maribacter sp. MMG018]
MKEEVLDKGNFRVLVAQTYGKLVTYKKQDNQEDFNKALLEILPEVKKYVASRLKAAVVRGELNSDMFSPGDFTDQLFIELYDHIDEIENEKELVPFLYKKVDELLDDSLTEEQFDSVFFDNIDKYSKPEWDAMEEDFSTDGDGDLMMVDELDDISYPKNNYTLDHVFVTNEEKELAEKLDKSLDKERIDRHIDFVLHKMALPMRTIFQLYNDQGFTAEEIAHIKKVSSEEVSELLKRARKILKDSFNKRFLIDSN